jgi:hypothetical protein
MSSSRTVSLFLHSPAPGIASPSLHTCTFRSLSSQHGIIRTRPQPQPQPHHRARFNLSSGPSFFSTSARSHEQNYYEILDLPTTATPAEIKKYVHHHPQDLLYRNPAPISNIPKKILRPLPPTPPRPQPHRPRRLPTLRAHLSSLQHARQRVQTRNLRPRPRLPHPTPPTTDRQPQQPQRKPPQRLRRVPGPIRAQQTPRHIPRPTAQFLRTRRVRQHRTHRSRVVDSRGRLRERCIWRWRGEQETTPRPGRLRGVY